MPAEHKLAVRDGERVREVLLVGTVTVGRSPTCEISSADPRLSRTHAAFDVVGGEVVVRDLDSANGTTVNGARITEHRLIAGDQVEVGPFVVQLVESSGAARRPSSPHRDDEATVMQPPRGARAAVPSPLSADIAPTRPAAPVASRANDPHDSAEKTRLLRRPPSPQPSTPPAETPPASQTRPRIEQPAPPVVEPPTSEPTPPPIAPPPEPVAVATPKVRRASTELTFANAALLCIVPLVLISFLGGFVPTLMQPDERTPLLRAHYGALATSAVNLVKASREPTLPIDAVTSALRRQTGVTSARIIGADGRVLAPLDQAGTTVPATVAGPTASSTIVKNADDTVEVQAPATTADGTPVLVSLTVDAEQIHPAPPGSSLATLLLIVSLGAAWLVSRRVTSITDSRLSRLGEEIELMTTKQISAGRDPFGPRGGQRIVDAVMFTVSPAGRVASGAPLTAPRADDTAVANATATASIGADAAFRILTVDQGCESLLGINSRTAPGTHLIDALADQAVADEVMRLLTMATPEGVASGEVVSGERGLRLSIDVTKGAGDVPLSIRFKKAVIRS